MEYVYHSNTINQAFNRFIKKSEINEFKQFIYHELMNMKGNKLENAYKNGYLDFLVYRMMKNQYVSETSPWAIKMRHLNEFTGMGIETVELKEYHVNTSMEKEPEVNKDKIFSDIKQLIELRNYGSNTFLKKQYHNTLFKMYYFEGHTYQEIQELTGVHWQQVRFSVIQTLEYIKKNLKDYGDYIP